MFGYSLMDHIRVTTKARFKKSNMVDLDYCHEKPRDCQPVITP